MSFQKSGENSVPSALYMNVLAQAPSLNTRTNIISGPGPRDYWFHSPGSEVPLVNEEGPFPIQGNIGSVLKHETNDFSNCGTNDSPDIGSGPNCTTGFVPDIYSVKDTCGSSCVLKYPESYGLKDFGFTEDQVKVSNAHQLHTYSNIRAGAPGQMSNNGCIEHVPNVVQNTEKGTCEMLNNPEYDQVGAWNRLPMYNSLQSVKYTPWK